MCIGGRAELRAEAAELRGLRQGNFEMVAPLRLRRRAVGAAPTVGLLKVETLQGSSLLLSGPAGGRETGRPSALALHPSFIAVGTTFGAVLVFDRQQELKVAVSAAKDAECTFKPNAGKSSRITEMLTKDRSSDVLEEMAAKEKEIAAATEAIEMKTEKNGEMAVKIVNLKNDLEDAQESLGEDQKFLAELKKGCSTAGADYDSRVKARAEELVAVQETIKILNDDDASGG